ncbi:hypothetical protein TruAng_003134 [Truncatella angustata]|nr:hypothetical protein TruAng_003134 [Truncatella angustata]
MPLDVLLGILHCTDLGGYLTMESILSTFAGRQVGYEEGDTFPWQPVAAPGVEPAKSLTFLRPVGPPPTGPVAGVQLDRGFRPQPVASSHRCQTESLFSSPAVPGTGNDDEQPAKERRVIKDPSQFRDIAAYLDTGQDEDGNEVSIVATCPYPNPETEPLQVLPCGHLIGAKCLDTHFRYKNQLIREDLDDHPNVDSALFVDCPMCRFPLDHPGCRQHDPDKNVWHVRHTVELRPYNPTLPRAGQVPLTILEGGEVEFYCRHCILAIREQNFKMFSEVLDHLLPNVANNRYIDSRDWSGHHNSILRW